MRRLDDNHSVCWMLGAEQKLLCRMIEHLLPRDTSTHVGLAASNDSITWDRKETDGQSFAVCRRIIPLQNRGAHVSGGNRGPTVLGALDQNLVASTKW